MLGILSDIGNVRKINEDYVGHFINREIGFYIVADGMGGHNAGEVASKLAVESIIDNIKSLKDYENIEEILIESILKANEKVYKLAKENSKLKGMGTTVTACLVKNQNMVVANVGDSSCYKLKKNGVFKITKDHSYVQQLIDKGTITKEEANTHPNKNVITRALGTFDSVKVDTFSVNLNDVYKVLLCTDGLTNYVNENEMYDIIMNNKTDNKLACNQLVDLSNLKGGKDNISVILFEGECRDDRENVGR